MPPTLKRCLELTPPSLSDNTADVDRLRSALQRRCGLHNVSLPLEALSQTSSILRQAQWRVTASLAPRPRGWRLVGLEPGDASTKAPVLMWPASASNDLTWPAAGDSFLGLAVDLGTTTLALELVESPSSRVLEAASVTNPQVELGPDILTRIQAVREHGVEVLQSLIIRGVNQGFETLVRRRGLPKEDITCLAVAGNTTMTHFFLGLDPAHICREPYIPVINRPDLYPAQALGLEAPPRAPVFTFPNVGSYLGGDVIAGLISSGLARSERVCLLIDVGTNAEVVVGDQDWLMGCAGAAGPALEGGVAKMGMPAGPGAIETVRIDPQSLEPTLSVIGSGPPLGLCGSGLIDLVAELFLAGVVDVRGRLAPLNHPRLIKTEEGWAFVLVSALESGLAEPILLSQVDLDVLLRSKAAMYTILTILLSQLNLSFEEIETFFIAGDFGQNIDPWRAEVLGLIPDLPLSRYKLVGNAALAGARAAILSAEARRLVEAVRKRLTYLELNVNQEFMNRFSAAKFIPHTDRALFPSVPAPRLRPEDRREDQ